MGAYRCPVCGTPHSVCMGATAPLPPLDLLYLSPRKGQTMALHEYKVVSGTRGGSMETTLLLSEEDAKAQGFTAKDRVSSKDQTTAEGPVPFEPVTEADLAPNEGETVVKSAARPSNKAASADSNK